MSHKFQEGIIYHKRVSPKKHEFKYKFFMLDIDMNSYEKLDNKYFSKNSFNLFSFNTKDHFGKSDDFKENIKEILNKYSIEATQKMRFITLPRILGYVFNPISVLILFEKDIPTYMIAEVHNYNGGRVIYPVKLESNDNKHYKGTGLKDMYVSPFFQRDGRYDFSLTYEANQFSLGINLFEKDEKMLNSTFVGKPRVFNEVNVVSLFFSHTLLTVWVVTRTLWQSLKLKLKGLKFNKPTAQDQVRRA
ncbi:MAG: DUF1365 domain-containing protein [Poseidonibacter sp.]